MTSTDFTHLDRIDNVEPDYRHADKEIVPGAAADTLLNLNVLKASTGQEQVVSVRIP